jgi:hypothetical protein
VRQSCSCRNVTNSTSRTWYWDCNCTRADNLAVMNFLYTNTSNCVAASNGSFNCCVSASQYASQINSISCSSNQVSQNCTCRNITNATTRTWTYNCNCTYRNGTATVARNNVSYSTNQCACNNLTNCTCCYTYYTIDESKCSASLAANSRYNSSSNNATNCPYQYEYYVAVVAQNKNSTVLL